jgi:hypothetical protein
MKRAKHTTTYEYYTVTQSSDGTIRVTSLIQKETIYPSMDNGNLRSLLRRLMQWHPWDHFHHVVAQIRKGRTYAIRVGVKDGVEFLN